MSDCDNIVIGICGGSKLTFSDMPCDNLRIEGADDVTINQGAGIDLTDGVHAYDGNGNEIPFTVEPDEIDKCEVGEHIVKYTAEGEGDMMLPTLCGKNRLHISSMCDNAILQEERVVTITQADPPVISGADGMEVNVGTVFDPMDGVSAVDDNGNEIEVEISGTYPRTANGEQLVSFDDGNGSLAESVKVTFEPYQSGTPSLAGTDTTPYIYRSAPSFGQAYNRQRPTVIGGTVAFNQIAYLRPTEHTSSSIGVTYTPISESSFRLHGTISAVNDTYLDYHSDAIQHIAGHKYIAWVSGSASASSYFKFHQGTKYYPNILNSPYMYEYTSGTRSNDIETLQTGDVDFTFHWNRIDLTQMFGSAIADYIYSLEQANAGAGVAWFKKLFPKPYYAYNAGSLQSVNVASHDMTGFNQWDEEWEQGAIANASGNNTGQADAIRSKNYIPVIGGTTYYINKQSSNLRFYDADKNYLGSDASISVSTNTFVVPSNASFMRFYVSNYGNVYNHDICINLSWDGERDGEYEEYVKHSYPLDSDLVLRGIPKLDASNNLYYDGDTYASDGTVTRKYGVVDLGTLNWARNTTNQFYTALPTASVNNTINMIANGYIASSYGAYNNNVDRSLTINGASGARLWCRDTRYDDLSSFVSAMSGVYLVYELATPTTESADPYTALQMADPNGTEEWVTSGIVPVGQETEYIQK